MKELDQQYEGGTAPCLPSRSFRSNERDTHRADKGPEDNTRPCGRRRTNHSASYNVSLQKAKEPNRFKIIDVEQYSLSQACITIKTSDGKFYSIHFDKSTTCSCPFSDIQIHIRQGKVPCKHRLFVLMAIGFSEEDEMLLQESYTALKIRNIISKVCNWQRIINDQPINPLQSSSQGKTCRDLKVSTACIAEHIHILPNVMAVKTISLLQTNKNLTILPYVISKFPTDASGNFQAKCNHCATSISGITKATSNFYTQLKVNLYCSFTN